MEAVLLGRKEIKAEASGTKTREEKTAKEDAKNTKLRGRANR